MRKILLTLATIMSLAIFTVAIQPRGTASADNPCRDNDPTTPCVRPTRVPTAAPAVCNYGYFLDRRINQCLPIPPPVPQVVCNAPNQLVPQASYTLPSYNSFGQVYYVNGQPYMNGAPYFGVNTYTGYNGLNSFNGLSNTLACVAPPTPVLTPVPVTNNVYIPVPAAAPVTAPSLPAAPRPTFIRPPSTGDAGLASP